MLQKVPNGLNDFIILTRSECFAVVNVYIEK